MDEKDQKKTDKKEKCFVIMPISDPDGYEKGHFRYVYEDLLKPAIEKAGFEAKRADDDDASNMIQVNIIRDIIEAPMAVCDLSTRNPNVLFELGIRQAFDLPVVLVQEQGTQRIFDISTINTIDYRSSLIYREVIEDREKISQAIKSTKDNTTGVNSIIRLLEIGNAKLDEKSKPSSIDDIKLMIYALSNQVGEMMKMKNNQEIDNKFVNDISLRFEEYFHIYKQYRSKLLNENISGEKALLMLQKISREVAKITSDNLLSEWQKNNLRLSYSQLEKYANRIIIKDANSP